MTVGVIGVALLLFLLWRSDRDGQAAGGDVGLANKIDRLIELQEQQAQRLERLEQSRPSIGAPSASASASSQAGDRDRPMPTPQELARMKEGLIRDLENKMSSQQLAPVWALDNERTITGFLNDENLDKEGLPKARNVRAECRTSLCRISMNFADEAQADITLHGLYTTMAGSLPVAQTFNSVAPDGSVEIRVYAERQNSPPRAVRP